MPQTMIWFFNIYHCTYTKDNRVDLFSDGSGENERIKEMKQCHKTREWCYRMTT